MKRATRTLCLMHLAGDALLLWLGYYWLGVGESTIGRLAWSAILAVLILCGALWLHGSAFAYFGSADRSRLSPATVAALRHLAPLFLLAIIVLTIYALLGWIKIPLKPSSSRAALVAALWIARRLILPAVFLPLGAAVASDGWRGFRGDPWRPLARALYWLEVLVLTLLGMWAPLKLLGWTPHLSSFRAQMASFMARLLSAYLLFVAAWLLLEFFSSGGSPRASQARTAGAP